MSMCLGCVLILTFNIHYHNNLISPPQKLLAKMLYFTFKNPMQKATFIGRKQHHTPTDIYMANKVGRFE